MVIGIGVGGIGGEGATVPEHAEYQASQSLGHSGTIYHPKLSSDPCMMGKRGVSRKDNDNQLLDRCS